MRGCTAVRLVVDPLSLESRESSLYVFGEGVTFIWGSIFIFEYFWGGREERASVSGTKYAASLIFILTSK